MDYHLILPKLYVGSYPGRADDIKLLKQQAGVTAVLNLQTDDDMQHFKLDWDSVARSLQKFGDRCSSDAGARL